MNIQTVIVFAIVAGAAYYVARKLWRSFRGQSDGACDKCVPDKGKHGV